MTKTKEIIEITQPYFTFRVEAWDADEERLKLPLDTNLENILKELKSGNNLFETIPGLSKSLFNKFKLEYGKFETKAQLKKGEIIFNQEGPYLQVGELLIPHYAILSRKDIKKKLLETTHFFSEQQYCSALLNNLQVPTFYYAGISLGYKPFNQNQMLMLTEKQLS